MMKRIPSALLFFFIFLTCPASSSADSAQYFYDDNGRLTRVVKGTAGVIYSYDETGNLVSVINDTTSASSPVLASINPNVFFTGSTMLVTITGQKLLTTDSVSAIGGLVAIDKIVSVTDTQIIAEMTALSTGAETIKVTTRNGTPNYATIGVTLSSSKLAFTPGQLALVRGSTGTITASISPPLSGPLTIILASSSPSVASVPQTVVIPVGGTANITVNALHNGVATISVGDTRTVVFVTSPFTGDVSGLSAKNISVYIDAPSGTSPASALPISVYVDAPQGTSPATALPVSVYLDAPQGSSPATAPPVSVYVDAPPGDSPTVAGGVSVKIQ